MILDFKEKEIYDKVMQRMKNMKILDPTNIIIELQKEIDDYRENIRCYREDIKKIRKEQHITDAVGKINYNHGLIVNEDKDYIYVETNYGTSKYSKLQLAIFWLQHSNDCFHETFGFNWVPDSKIQEQARKIVNENILKKIVKTPEVKIGIDFADAMSYSIENSFTGFMGENR